MEKETEKEMEKVTEGGGSERGIKGERPNHITRVRLGKRKSLSDEKAI